MLTGAERTMLLWQLSSELEQLNKKLRSLTLSITIYDLKMCGIVPSQAK